MSEFHKKKRGNSLILTLGALSLLTSCLDNSGGSSGTSDPLVSRGKTIYVTTCIACHNSDPKKPGPIGPEIFGSSKELLEARVLNASYPPGYKPKRDTHTMSAFPQFKDDIAAIHAYLNAN